MRYRQNKTPASAANRQNDSQRLQECRVQTPVDLLSHDTQFCGGVCDVAICSSCAPTLKVSNNLGTNSNSGTASTFLKISHAELANRNLASAFLNFSHGSVP